MIVELLRSLTDLVWPAGCAGCGRPGRPLCEACEPRCGPFPVAHAHLVVRAAAHYEDAIRRALIAYKDRSRRDLAGPLGDLLARAVGDLLAGGAGTWDELDGFAPPLRLVLVGVPSARAVARARGGDHVSLLARAAGRRLGVPAVPALRQTRPVRDSAGLGVIARKSNLAGSMVARHRPPGGVAAIVVDDIVTSGSTLGEAVRALRADGWPVVGAAVVAATPRRRRGGDGPGSGYVTGWRSSVSMT